MKKEYSHTNKGFSLVEIIVSVAVFLVFVIPITDTVVNSKIQIRSSVNKSKATYLADEALEVLRNLRDIDFSNLIDGDHGLGVVNSQWSLIGNSDTTDIFTRVVNISTISETQKEISASVSWSDQISSFNLITHNTYLTDWRKITPANCADQASFMDVEIIEVDLINKDKTVTGISFGSTAPNCDIIVDKISIDYDGKEKLQEIFIDDSSVWTGNSKSGDINDILDFTIIPQQSDTSSEYKFNKKMKNKTLTITYIMLDGTTKVITGISL